jgi:hypothetical protein
MAEAFRIEPLSFAAPADPVKMVERVLQFSPSTDAEALKLLRASFPGYPLSLRVAALGLLMKRQSRTQVAATSPDKPAARGHR